MEVSSMCISALSMFGNDPLVSIVLILTFAIIPLIIWSIYASIKVNTTYSHYSQVRARKGMTAYEVTRRILDANGLDYVQIRECRGSLTDHFDPRTNTVFLSQATINSTSVAAIGVAAHEVGHAVQHAEGYTPVKVRGALVPILNFTSRLIIPLLLINVITAAIIPFGTTSCALVIVMIAFYLLNMLFGLITLPCEFNASSRAKEMLLAKGVLDSEEVAMTSKVLSAAAMTYVASFAMSLVQLLRLLAILLMRRNRD